MKSTLLPALLLVFTACKPPTSPPAAALQPGPVPTPTVSSAPQTTPSPKKEATVQSPLKLELLVDKDSFLIGENILVHFTLTNVSEAPVTIEVGGDYRGAARQTRFLVTATDSQGAQVKDPFPNNMNMGGLTPTFTLKPKEQFVHSLPLMSYVDLAETGSYTIRITHDLGWNSSPTPPSAELVINVKVPTAQEAKEVLAQMKALPKDPNNTWGKRAVPYADFTALRHPIYLNLVEELAKSGDLRSIHTLSDTKTVDATRSLLTLSSDPKNSLATAALEALIWRVPTSKMTPDKGLWDDSLREPTLTLAWSLLSSKETGQISTGARMIGGLAGPEDFDKLLKRADEVLLLVAKDAVEQGAYPRPFTASDSLFEALGALLQRGATLPKDVSTPGRAAAFVMAFAAGKRPTGWEKSFDTVLQHPIARLRALALEHLPAERAVLQKKELLAALKDPYPTVQNAAAILAVRSKDTSFATPLMEAVSASKDHWILSSAVYAATECKAPLDELYTRIAERLSDPLYAQIFFEQVINLIKSEGGYGSSNIDWSAVAASDLKQQWLDFIKSNREEIKAGKTFPMARPPVTEALIPKGFSFSKKDGTEWPARKE